MPRDTNTRAPNARRPIDADDSPARPTAPGKRAATSRTAPPRTGAREVVQAKPADTGSHDRDDTARWTATAIRPDLYPAPTGVVQRKIRVDSVDDGEEFEDAGYVQSHWGFTTEEKKVFLKWIRDGEDHHYATKQDLIDAVKGSVTPTTSSFATLFGGLAVKANQSSSWLEQLLTDPGNTVTTLKQETATSMLEKLDERGSTVDAKALQGMSVEKLLDELLATGILTQSCGQTVMLLRDLLAPKQEAAPLETSVQNVLAAIRHASDASGSKRVHHYVTIEGAGHAFVVEVFNEVCKIYQSFFGRYTLAKDMGLGKSFPMGLFLNLLETAFTPDPPKGGAPSKVVQARNTLFSSTAIHPDGKFRVDTFTQEDGVEERFEDAYMEGAKSWSGTLKGKATDSLKPEVKVEEPKGKMTMAYDDCRFYDISYTPVSTTDVEANKTYVLYYKGKYNVSVKVLANDTSGKKLEVEVE